MNILASSTKKRKTKGLVIVHTGNGKGKTTAALGLLLRAWGSDMKVVILQFVKRPTNCGDHRAINQIGVEIIAGGVGLTQRGTKNAGRNKHLAIELWNMAMEKINSASYHMVILDEISYPLRYDWLSVEEVIDVLKHRPKKVHVVLTGRDIAQELIDFADIVTDMRAVKHALQKGVKAQPGVEF
jgi:cob(I)alamin adenosyltransferase